MELFKEKMNKASPAICRALTVFLLIGLFSPLSAQQISNQTQATGPISIAQVPIDHRLLPESGIHNDTTNVMLAANAFLKAFNNLEWETFYSGFSPSATVFQPFGNPFRHNDREELAEFFKSFFDQIKSTTEGPPYLNITPQDMRIQMIDQAAVVTFHLPGNNVGRRTLVFGRYGPADSWQIAHLHASSLEAPGKRSPDVPVSKEFDIRKAPLYTGRYRLISEDMNLVVTIKPGADGMEAEMGDYKSQLRYVGGHAFQEMITGSFFVFNVMSENRATGITSLTPELERVEVFELVED